jgi:hypothetical protein
MQGRHRLLRGPRQAGVPEGTLGLKSRSDVKAHHTIRMTTKVETEALLKNRIEFLETCFASGNNM